TGVAGHAGTVPMTHRHDALLAASEFVIAAESFARGEAGLVATVGQLAGAPGASNVIPGQVALSLDVRHPEDGVRERALAQLHERAQAIGAARGIAITWQSVADNRSVPCAPTLTDLLARAVAEAGHPVRRLPSGAGHDAVTLSALAQVAMLCVRCTAGLRH